MQLVLGASVSDGPARAGAPLPAPPPDRGRRALRRIAWALAFVLVAALGALHGATTAIGANGLGELARAPRPAAQPPREAEGALGSFWRPERSNAERPPAEIAPRRWRPERND